MQFFRKMGSIGVSKDDIGPEDVRAQVQHHDFDKLARACSFVFKKARKPIDYFTALKIALIAGFDEDTVIDILMKADGDDFISQDSAFFHKMARLQNTAISEEQTFAKNKARFNISVVTNGEELHMPYIDFLISNPADDSALFNYALDLDEACDSGVSTPYKLRYTLESEDDKKVGPILNPEPDNEGFHPFEMVTGAERKNGSYTEYDGKSYSVHMPADIDLDMDHMRATLDKHCLLTLVTMANAGHEVIAFNEKCDPEYVWAMIHATERVGGITIDPKSLKKTGLSSEMRAEAIDYLARKETFKRYETVMEKYKDTAYMADAEARFNAHREYPPGPRGDKSGAARRHADNIPFFNPYT